MTTLKTVTLVAALVAGATSLAFAQNAPTAAGGDNGMPPKDYKGPGAMQSYPASQFRGNPALYNQASGYGTNTGMPPKDYKGPGAMPAYPSSPEANAAASGGGGTHVSSQKTGTAENTQKVMRNQNGYRGLYAYQPSQRCLILRREGRILPRSCR